MSVLRDSLEHEGKKGNQRTFMINERGMWLNNNHIYLEERFLQRPALKAVNELPGSDSTSPTAAALLAYTIANKNFSVLGQAMTTALCTHSASGGITLTTAGSSGDQAVVEPSLTTGITEWSAINWLSEKSPRFECFIRTPATITSYCMWAGFKLTLTDVLATDADAAFFKFSTTADTGGSATNLTVCIARAGIKVVTVLPIVITASTLYRLTLSVNAQRQVFARVATTFQPKDTTGTAVASTNLEFSSKSFRLIPGVDSVTGADNTAALTTAINFIPYVGVKALTGAARALDVMELKCGRAA